MGRIKIMLVKRTGKKLAEKEDFDSTFERNKKLLVGTMPSKRIRNMIAGYIARLKRNAKQKV